ALAALLAIGAAAAGTCSTPTHVGPMIDAATCSSVNQCGQCSALCTCGTAGVGCIGTNTQLRCLGENDPLRNTTESKFLLETCDSSASAGKLGLVAAARCGVLPCCPEKPYVPTGCLDYLDNWTSVQGQCQAFVASGAYSCDADFCPTCGAMAGLCDKTCKYGLCAVCGDCWRENKLSVGGEKRCDDGNVADGDGCNSNCEVETGWTCSRAVKLAKYMSNNAVANLELDECTRCTNRPGWTDIQGYGCSDYEAFDACDANSTANDPIVLGGRTLTTPEYFYYTFAYDLAIRKNVPLELVFGVRAEGNAHLFIGRAQEFGFEIVIGGWNNGLSVLRQYPGRIAVDNYYGEELHHLETRYFWVYCGFTGNLTVGRGKVLHQNIFLKGAYYGTEWNTAHGWANNTNVSKLNQVSVSTGWRSTGEWDVRVLSASASPSLGSLTNGGIDATVACCACGGGFTGRPCELEAALPKQPSWNFEKCSEADFRGGD
ncbi:unnamed protein product, partial [Polarella glacialis]